MKKSHQGNVLFIILIAVALFAALSYAVSNSFRGGTSTISSEQARVAAGDLLRSMESIKQGYQYLWVQEGCSIDEISLIQSGMSIGAEDFDASSPKSDETCDVFEPLGAGISYPRNLSELQDTTDAGTAYGKFLFWFAGYNPGGTYGIQDLGTSSSDHMIFLQGVQSEICVNVNKLLDYDNYTTDLIDAGNTIGDAAGNVFAEKKSGCRARASGGPYDVFFVLQDL